jgi:hypothetical protein
VNRLTGTAGQLGGEDSKYNDRRLAAPSGAPSEGRSPGGDENACKSGGNKQSIKKTENRYLMRSILFIKNSKILMPRPILYHAVARILKLSAEAFTA